MRNQMVADGVFMDDDEVFRALGDPSRRLLLDRLFEQNGQSLNALCEGLGMSRQAVSKHLDVLEAANLISSQRLGRARHHFINPVPIHALSERWIRKFEVSRLDALIHLKSSLEGKMVQNSQSQCVYVSYIRTTPEKLWHALTDGEFAKTYWFGISPSADWREGGDWKLTRPDGNVSDTGVITILQPLKRLSIHWQHQLNPEFKAEGPSQCDITLEPEGDVVKLTICHGMKRADSKFIGIVATGWPQIISNLKSLLETGAISLHQLWNSPAKTSELA